MQGGWCQLPGQHFSFLSLMRMVGSRKEGEAPLSTERSSSWAFSEEVALSSALEGMRNHLGEGVPGKRVLALLQREGFPTAQSGRALGEPGHLDF